MFNDYYEQLFKENTGNWGYDEHDTQYFCFVQFNIESGNLTTFFSNFKANNYTYNNGWENPQSYTYQFDFNSGNAQKWELRGYNWRFPIHSTFIGADMIIEREAQDANQIYILFNDKIIRFKHYLNSFRFN